MFAIAFQSVLAERRLVDIVWTQADEHATSGRMKSPLLLAVSEFYAASTQPELFPSALASAMNLVGADTGYSWVQVGEKPPVTLAYREVGGPDLIGLYESQFADQDVWVQALMANEKGKAHVMDDLVPTQELQRTSFYGDFLRPNYDILHALGIVIPVGPDSSAMLGFHKIAKHDAFTDAQRRRLQTIAPHVGRALHLSHRHREWSETSHFAQALDRLNTAMVIVDGQERIAFANIAAQRLLQAPDGLTVKSGRLFIEDSGAAEGFERALSVALSGQIVPETKLTIRVPTRRRQRGILVSIFPLYSASQGLTASTEAALVVLIEPAIRIPGSDAEVLTLFGLTAAEARLAALLVQGTRLEVCAEMVSISRNTARNQLASIFAKVGVNRQSDLIALVSSLKRP